MMIMKNEIIFPYTCNDQFIPIHTEHGRLINKETISKKQLKNHSFILKTKGRGTITIDGHAFCTDRPILLHAPKRSIFTVTGEESFEYYKFSYHVRPNPSRLVEPSIFLVEPANILPFYEIAAQLIESITEQHHAPFRSVGLFYNFLTLIMKETHIAKDAKPGLNVTEQVIDWLEDKYKYQITLEDLSDSFQYSTKHLSRLVKNETGMSPIQYLIHVRIEKAKSMLKNTDAKLNEIARRVGYNDLFYFSNHFKKKVGMSPTEYKKLHSKRQESINGKSGKSISMIEYSSYNLNENNYQLREDLLLMIKRFGFKPYLTGMLCFVLILQGCGNEDEGNPEEDDSSEEETAEENADFPRTVTDAAGNEITLEEPPERIALTHWTRADYLLSLGITPLASTGIKNLQGTEALDQYEEEISQVEDIGDAGVIDMETLVGLEPDLILGRVQDEESSLEQLEQIAPTYQTDFTDDWAGAMQTVGELTGKEAESEDLTSGLEAEIVETKEALDYDPEDTVAIVRLYGGMENMWVVGDDIYQYLFDDEEGLGLNAPENYPGEGGEISMESLIDLNPDYLILVDEDENVYENAVQELNDSDAWQTTNAAQNDEVHYANSLTFGPVEIQDTLNRMKEIFGET